MAARGAPRGRGGAASGGRGGGSFGNRGGLKGGPPKIVLAKLMNCVRQVAEIFSPLMALPQPF